MKRLISATCLAAIFATGASARSSTGQTTPATTPQHSKVQILTVTGCLRAGAEANTFVLSDLEWKSAGTPKEPAAAPAAQPAPPAAASGVTLKLVGAPGGVRLSEHVGHTVELTGILIDEPSSAPAPSAVPATDAAPAGIAGDRTSRASRAQEAQAQTKPEHTFNVRTIRMIADRCE